MTDMMFKTIRKISDKITKSTSTLKFTATIYTFVKIISAIYIIYCTITSMECLNLIIYLELRLLINETLTSLFINSF